MELISEDKLRVLASQKKKDLIMLEKDYFLTLFLYLTKDREGLYFKGGTALNKIFLNHIRLSEDLDYTITIPLSDVRDIIDQIIRENGNIFTTLKYDKNVDDFTRYLLHYKSYFKKDSSIILDFNKRAKLSSNPEKNTIKNFYGYQFKVHTLSKEEIIAEKVCALLNRNKPRDYYDVYQIITKNISINMDLVERKCYLQGQQCNILKIFDKSKKIYQNWEKDLSQLTEKMIPFTTVMKVLKEYFKYAEEKEKAKRLIL